MMEQKLNSSGYADNSKTDTIHQKLSKHKITSIYYAQDGLNRYLEQYLLALLGKKASIKVSIDQQIFKLNIRHHEKRPTHTHKHEKPKSQTLVNIYVGKVFKQQWLLADMRKGANLLIYFPVFGLSLVTLLGLHAIFDQSKSSNLTFGLHNNLG